METRVLKEIPTSKVMFLTSSESTKYYPTNFFPGPNDVIIGRGKKSYQHQGNVKLRRIVSSMMDAYSSAATKSDKSKIISMVVSYMKRSSPDGACFVKEDPNVEGLWLDVDMTIVREKVSQMFRDALHDKYRSSNEYRKRNHRILQCNRAKHICKHPEKELFKEKPVDNEWENNDEVMQSLHILDSRGFYQCSKKLFFTLSSSLPESSELAQWLEDDINLFKPISVPGSLDVIFRSQKCFPMPWSQEDLDMQLLSNNGMAHTA